MSSCCSRTCLRPHMTFTHHISSGCSWPGWSLRLSWFERPQWFGGGLGRDMQTVPLLVCLIFSRYYSGLGGGRPQRESALPTTSRQGLCSQHDSSPWLCPWSPGWGVPVRCLCWGDPLSPLSILFSLGGRHHVQTTLKGGVWAPSQTLKGGVWASSQTRRAQPSIYMTWNASTQICLFSPFTYLVFFSYQCGPMSVYFILWSVLQHYVTYSVAPSIPAFVAPPWLLWPFNTPSLQALFVLSTALLSGTVRS